MAKDKKRVSAIVTERIIEMLQEGIIPWVKPYIADATAPRGYDMPRGKTYTGINRLLLPLPGEYLTEAAVQKHGGAIIDKSKFFIATFYKQSAVPVDANDPDGEELIRRTFRYYRVYHISNTEGIPSKLERAEEGTESRQAEGHALAHGYIRNASMTLIKRSGEPHYDASTRTATIPGAVQFANDESYYSSLFNVLSKDAFKEATGKDLLEDTDECTLAELVAELSSAMLMSYCGMDSTKVVRNSAALIQRWLRALKASDSLIISAAKQAEKVFDYIVSMQPLADVTPQAA